jgi:putative membrane protein
MEFSARDLPALNAVLNTTSAALLAAGYLLIRAGRRDMHRQVMLAALVTSSLFLASYLVYHFEVGSVRFQRQGPIRSLYFAVLASHTLLAVVILPLIAVSLRHAFAGRFPAHRRIARITLPLWAYVSVTGVAIYWMLYRL